MEKSNFKAPRLKGDMVLNEPSFFREAGNLESERLRTSRLKGDMLYNKKRNSTDLSKLLKKNIEIDDSKEILEEFIKGTLSEENAKKFLNKIVSEKGHPDRWEGKLMSEAGRIIVNPEKLVEMIISGYDIINAEYLTNDKISIEYKKFIETNKKLMK